MREMLELSRRLVVYFTQVPHGAFNGAQANLFSLLTQFHHHRAHLQFLKLLSPFQQHLFDNLFHQGRLPLTSGEGGIHAIAQIIDIKELDAGDQFHRRVNIARHRQIQQD